MLEEWKLIDNSFYISNFVNVKALNGRIINMPNRKSMEKRMQTMIAHGYWKDK